MFTFSSVNALNQYTGISTENTENAEEANNSVGSVSSVFYPIYDDDGNATQIQTSTGTWVVEYNAENRPVRWTNAATGTVITMAFDSQGRRVEYKSVTNMASLPLRRLFVRAGFVFEHALQCLQRVCLGSDGAGRDAPARLPLSAEQLEFVLHF